MTDRTKTFAIVDPRSFDGDPFEVGERSCEQVAAMIRLTLWCVEGANIMARNAEMERTLMEGDDAKAPDWEGSVQGRQWQAVKETLEKLEGTTKVLSKAASFNPKARIPRDA